MIAEIITKKGIKIIVDKEDYEKLSKYNWYISAGGYAVREIHIGTLNGQRIRKSVYLHRLVNNTPEGVDTDHVNGIKLDNRKSNLRSCDKFQNLRNQKIQKREGKTSKYKGVSWVKRISLWEAYIGKSNPAGRSKKIPLGYFKEEEHAAIAYNKAASEMFKEFARLNEI